MKVASQDPSPKAVRDVVEKILKGGKAKSDATKKAVKETVQNVVE